MTLDIQNGFYHIPVAPVWNVNRRQAQLQAERPGCKNQGYSDQYCTDGKT